MQACQHTKSVQVAISIPACAQGKAQSQVVQTQCKVPYENGGVKAY